VLCVCVCVWKHTLAVLSPLSPESPLQNQKLKPAASPRREKRLFPLKPAEESSPFPTAAASPSQVIIVHHPFVLYGLSGYSDACNLTPLRKHPVTLPCSVSSKGGLLPHAFH
jgi:hypothetical protein